MSRLSQTTSRRARAKQGRRHRSPHLEVLDGVDVSRATADDEQRTNEDEEKAADHGTYGSKAAGAERGAAAAGGDSRGWPTTPGSTPSPVSPPW